MTTPEKVFNPHDRLFREAFRHRDVALDELHRILPSKLLARLDLQRIQLDETALMDALFRQLFSDRLFQVPLKNGGSLFVWILFEHQSVVDRMIVLRVLEYGTARWRSFRTMHPEAKQIPILIPILIQHDPQDRTAPVQLSQLYMGDDALKDALGPYLIDYRLHIDDLQKQTADELAIHCQNPILRAVLIALRERGAVPRDQLPRWRTLIADIIQTHNSDALRLLVWYLLIGGSDHVVKSIGEEQPMVQQATRNIIDETFMKGRIEGEKSGEIKNMMKVLQRQLQNRNFPISQDLALRLETAALDELQNWHDRLDRGETPKDIFTPAGSDGE